MEAFKSKDKGDSIQRDSQVIDKREEIPESKRNYSRDKRKHCIKYADVFSNKECKLTYEFNPSLWIVIGCLLG